ncbi:MAG TPA: hypothetical protein VFP92_03645 [Rhodanobacteraceae bacterium]|nr:hypothetical protein [Rhodanobacteraceae bacterium]
MSFNTDELLKIEGATSGWLKKRTRLAISEALSALASRIERLNSMNSSERQDALKVMVNEATRKRQEAVVAGANSHGDVRWAPAAACESWLQDIALGDARSNAEVGRIVKRLIERVK